MARQGIESLWLLIKELTLVKQKELIVNKAIAAEYAKYMEIQDVIINLIFLI